MSNNSMSMDQNQPGSARLGASFRDPNGFLFTRAGVLYRQVNREYQANYDRLISSGLYQALVEAGCLVSHQEVGVEPAEPDLAYRVIQPEKIQFISYPYEWSFSQLRAAALLTLKVQKLSLEKGMSLKDASAYNIQFHRGKPVLIDSLSFEAYPEGQPWVAYRQFCQHFLAPLSLMAYTDVRLSQLLRVYIDGLPLDLASRLLPGSTRLKLPVLMHIHLHAASQKRFAGSSIQTSRQVNRVSFLGLIDNLESFIRGLSWKPAGTAWADYYAEHNYTASGLEHKKHLVAEFIESASPRSAWDLGANTGVFSRLASERGIPTVAFDVDPAAVELCYRDATARKDPNLLPLLLDLTNPSPALGWHNRERRAWIERGPVDLVLALALIHHLAIANNVPLGQIAGLFAQLGEWLVVEFVPKSDSQVQRLLVARADIFPDYTAEGFERAFSERFAILRCENIQDSQRQLYLMRRKP